MQGRLSRVFEPLAVGGMQLPNRIVRAAHDTGLGSPGITADHIAYHAARARGGCGLTILEASSVHPSSRLHVALFRDDVVPELAELVAAVRPHGMKLVQQLWHGGNLYPGFSGGPPWSVSDVPGVLGMVGRTMTRRDLAELLDAFVAAAVRCERAGLDGVEVHACHGYLFHQFLTPAFNTRDDDYGGSFENRSRFLFEVMRAIRAAIRPGFAVGVRLGASEAPGGVSVEDNQRLIRGLQNERLIDFVDVSVGDYFRMDSMVGAMQQPSGYELATTAEIASVAAVPRILTGRFRTLQEAEQVLRSGQAELVSMVRALIADPDLVVKSRAGVPEQVRPCIGCNQGCIGGLFRVGRMGCLVNAEVGFEALFGDGTPVTQPRRVLVVGGGPAGLETARVARLAGHDVILAEAQSFLGGTARIAAAAPHLAGLRDILDWLESEVSRLGVQVRLGAALDAVDVESLAPDVVVVAAGASPRMAAFQAGRPGDLIEGLDRPGVYSALDLLTAPPLPRSGAHALVYDTTGHYEAIAAVDLLLRADMTVTHITPAPSLSPYLQTTWRDVPALERFHVNGRFKSLVRHALIGVDDGYCRIRALQAPQEREERVPAEVVVLVLPGHPRAQLFDELRERGFDVRLVGDAHSPRDMQAAIAEGYSTARSIS
jgi:2,4-dienoyl-CoA reductase-like NADH-dependent reductase (Old Yellow Enzyme family)